METLLLKFWRSMMVIRELLMSVHKLAEIWEPPEKDFLGIALTLTSKHSMEIKERCPLFLTTLPAPTVDELEPCQLPERKSCMAQAHYHTAGQLRQQQPLRHRKLTTGVRICFFSWKGWLSIKRLLIAIVVFLSAGPDLISSYSNLCS